MKAIDFFDADELIHCSFRYFLGRRTIATCAFAKNLAKAWDYLMPTTREMIGQELLKAYAEAEKKPDWKPLGDDCDREAWDLVKFLTKRHEIRKKSDKNNSITRGKQAIQRISY